MKKTILLTALAVSLPVFGGMSLTAEASPVRQETYKNVTVIHGNSLNDLKDKLDELKNCLPEIDWDLICPPGGQPDTTPPQNPDAPDEESPDTPGTETPAPDAPDDAPDTEKPDQPDVEAPDQNKPETPDTPDTDAPETDQQLSYAQQVVALVNAEREKRGLSTLTLREDVGAAAMVRAKEIQTSFSHTRPDGRSFSTALTEQNVVFRGSGENIAWGQKTPQEVMNGWMNSDGHRANILNEKFTSIGVGYLQNASGTGYWTQLFTY